MTLGVDFDNTIACYDGVFHRAAVAAGLIPDGPPLTKDQVRDLLRAQGREDDWTRLQGAVYGPRMGDAKPFAGVKGFFEKCLKRGLPVCIVSHRTATPYLGPAYDLLGAAQQWLEANGFYALGLSKADVHFELTKKAKLARIAARGCDRFIDDLPEFLAEPEFPQAAEPILFDPSGAHQRQTRFRRAGSWAEIDALLLEATR